jgi:hypothetical protein
MTRIAFAAVSLFSFACFAQIRGSGNVQHETRVVGEFSGVSVSGGIRGEVQIGKQHVELEADDNVLPLVETVIDDGILVVRFKPHQWLNTRTPVVVHVTAPSIDALESSGGSGLKADMGHAEEPASPATGGARMRGALEELAIESSGGGDVQAHNVSVKKLKAEVSGGGALILDGSADDVKLSMSGGSRCKGEKLQARVVRIRASGGSTARLAASESVNGSASGGSVIHVRGNPQTHVSSSGGSTVETD